MWNQNFVRVEKGGTGVYYATTLAQNRIKFVGLLTPENDITNVSAHKNDYPATGLSSQPNQSTNINVTPNKVISMSPENDIKNASAQENDCPGTGLSSQPNESTNINVIPNKEVILISDKNFSNSDELSLSKMKEFSFTLWNSLPNAENKLTDHALALATKHHNRFNKFTKLKHLCLYTEKDACQNML